MEVHVVVSFTVFGNFHGGLQTMGGIHVFEPSNLTWNPATIMSEGPPGARDMTTSVKRAVVMEDVLVNNHVKKAFKTVSDGVLNMQHAHFGSHNDNIMIVYYYTRMLYCVLSNCVRGRVLKLVCCLIWGEGGHVPNFVFVGFLKRDPGHCFCWGDLGHGFSLRFLLGVMPSALFYSYFSGAHILNSVSVV